MNNIHPLLRDQPRRRPGRTALIIVSLLTVATCSMLPHSHEERTATTAAPAKQTESIEALDIQEVLTVMHHPHHPSEEIRQLYRNMDADTQTLMKMIFVRIVVHCKIDARCRMDQLNAATSMIRHGPNDRMLACSARWVTDKDSDFVRANQCFKRGE